MLLQRTCMWSKTTQPPTSSPLPTDPGAECQASVLEMARLPRSSSMPAVLRWMGGSGCRVLNLGPGFGSESVVQLLGQETKPASKGRRVVLNRMLSRK